MNVTPAMQQYYDIKSDYQDAILFFRMGDFYEMFEEDAKIAHKVLGIALTTRNKNAENPILLAGVPFHAKEKYLPLLSQAGYKIAIAEQVSDPKLKWIVKREVVRVVTPWTLALEEENYNTWAQDNLIISLVESGEKYGISLLNFSKQSWLTSEFESLEHCLNELYKLAPKEIILEKKLFGKSEIWELIDKKIGLQIYYFEPQKSAKKYLQDSLGVKNLRWYGLEDKTLAQNASAMLLEYIQNTQKSDFSFLQKLCFHEFSWYMHLDIATIKNLDLVYNTATNSKQVWTMFWAIDYTKSSMGKRFLYESILRPLQDEKEIKKRQKFISILKSDPQLLEKIGKHLWEISDMDAILWRLSFQRAGPRDLVQLKRSLIAIREIINILKTSDNKDLLKIF